MTDGIYEGLTRVVYTVILGDYDHLRPPQSQWNRDDFEYVCFADKPEQHQGKGWKVVQVETPEGDGGRACREYFDAPHHFMPNVEYSILIPGNGQVTQSPHGIFEGVREAPYIALPNHPTGCIYKEGEACIKLRKDDTEIILAQMQQYRDEGYPPKNGLHCCTFIIRRHTDQVRVFGDLWWAEVSRWSKRDQLSFDYIVWKTGTPVRTLNGHYRHAGKRYNTSGAHRSNGMEPRPKKKKRRGYKRRGRR